jgi:hypothetical protein
MVSASSADTKDHLMHNKLLVKSAMALALAAPLLVSAESVVSTGAGALTASARLDFRIIIPKVLFLAVGSGAAGATLTANPTIDLVTFDYTTNAAAVGTGAVAGAITGNVVPVRVVGNNGAISVTANTVGALTNGAATDTIAWTEITAVSSDAANFPHPAIPAAGAGAAASIAVSSGKVTNRTANWTYSYANSAVVPAGTYGAIVANNSRVTYTASMP